MILGGWRDRGVVWGVWGVVERVGWGRDGGKAGRHGPARLEGDGAYHCGMEWVEAEARSGVVRSFRVDSLAGVMDVSLPAAGDEVVKRWRVAWPGLRGEGDWQVGAVVGPSGSGKGKVTRAMLGEAFLEVGPGRVSAFEWPVEGSVVDGFPAAVSGGRVGELFQAVGFSDAPAWLLPWGRLSTGQRWRAELARALVEDRPVVGVDEFGALVSDLEAATAARAVSKAVRKGRTGAKRVVLVGAKGVGSGGDLGEGWLRWAEPDWWVDMEDGVLRGWDAGSGGGGGGDGEEVAGGDAGGFCGGERGRFEVEVRRCRAAERWPVYWSHHYLSSRLRKGATGYEAWVRMGGWRGGRAGPWVAGGFVAMSGMMGKPGTRTVHRLVVLPGLQGVGLCGICWRRWRGWSLVGWAWIGW